MFCLPLLTFFFFCFSIYSVIQITLYIWCVIIYYEALQSLPYLHYIYHAANRFVIHKGQFCNRNHGNIFSNKSTALLLGL
jgi:hypothetical protein